MNVLFDTAKLAEDAGISRAQLKKLEDSIRRAACLLPKQACSGTDRLTVLGSVRFLNAAAQDQAQDLQTLEARRRRT